MGKMLNRWSGVRITAGNVANHLPRDSIKIYQSVNECVHSYVTAHYHRLSYPAGVHPTHMDCWDTWGAVGKAVGRPHAARTPSGHDLAQNTRPATVVCSLPTIFFQLVSCPPALRGNRKRSRRAGGAINLYVGYVLLCIQPGPRVPAPQGMAEWIGFE